MVCGAGDGEHRGNGDDGFDAVSGGQRADDPRLDRDLASGAGVEDQTQAGRSDLHYVDIMRDTDLVGGEVVGVLTGGCALQIDNQVYTRRRHIAQDAGRAAEEDLRLGKDVGSVVEILRRRGELNRNPQRDLRDRFAGHAVPHEDGNDQRQQFEQGVIEDEVVDARDHSCSLRSPVRSGELSASTELEMGWKCGDCGA